MYKTEIMDEKAVFRSLIRITHEIIEKNKGVTDISIVGIKRRGATISSIIADNIKKFENVSVPVGLLDITCYRDDLTLLENAPVLSKKVTELDVKGRNIIIVDDVIYTGRTARAAIEAVFSFGRPSSIQLAVLIDRGHRELPIRPDYVGKNVPTSKDELISVCVDEYDGKTGVFICADKKN